MYEFEEYRSSGYVFIKKNLICDMNVLKTDYENSVTTWNMIEMPRVGTLTVCKLELVMCVA